MITYMENLHFVDVKIRENLTWGDYSEISDLTQSNHMNLRNDS